MTDLAPESRLPRTGTLVLIAAVLLVGGGALIVWLPYHREQQIIAEVEKLGGQTFPMIFRPSWIPDAVSYYRCAENPVNLAGLRWLPEIGLRGTLRSNSLCHLGPQHAIISG
ncbi:hypothetical protein Pan258_21540 [Symmachiella dynata]|nr:hypothetical protein Pan258_21540 [Symmachiella dynata]